MILHHTCYMDDNCFCWELCPPLYLDADFFNKAVRIAGQGLSALYQISSRRLTVFTRQIQKQPFSERLVFSIYETVNLGQTPRRRPEGSSCAVQMAELNFNDH